MEEDKQLCDMRRYSPRSKGRCPQCGRERCFTFFVWKGTDDVIDDSFGICDHATKCGYKSLPWESPQWEELKSGERPKVDVAYIKKEEPPFVPLDKSYLLRSLVVINSDEGFSFRSSTLTDYLATLPFVTPEDIALAAVRYHLGTTKDKSTIWWQVDEEGKVHAGKIMCYKEDGHRDKNRFGGWVHSIMKARGLLNEDWYLKQCLFGQHLLNLEENKGKHIAIVESEKTAMLMSIFQPKFVWMACGGITLLKKERIASLIELNKWIVLFPDRDAHKVWEEKAAEIGYDRMSVNDYTKVKATDKDGRTADILDITLRILKEQWDREHDPYEIAKSVLKIKGEHEPLRTLIQTLGLQYEDG